MCAFKNELRNYRFYQADIKNTEEDIEFLYDKLGGSPRSPRTDSMPIRGQKNIDAEYDIRDKIALLEAKRSLLINKLKYLDEVLERMEKASQEALIEIYVYNKPFKVVADNFFISDTGLRKRLNKEIAEALKII